MNTYCFVLDSKDRILFRRKLLDLSEEDKIIKKYPESPYYKVLFLKGHGMDAALLQAGIVVCGHPAYVMKSDLKTRFQFNDKSIRIFLGEPDQMRISKRNPDRVMHLYMMARVEAVMESKEWRDFKAESRTRRKSRITNSEMLGSLRSESESGSGSVSGSDSVSDTGQESAAESIIKRIFRKVLKKEIRAEES